VTKLREKMIRAMDLKNLSDHTKRSYLGAVNALAKHYRQSFETISDKMIDDYLLYLKNEKGNAPATCCSALNALRFFYSHVLDKQISVDFSLSKKPRRLPTVLTK
jgi:site-specific recombinase XerD